MIGLGLVYLLRQRPDITEANYLADGFWSDAVEELPDGSKMLVRDIKRLLDGEEFGYIPNGEKRMKKLSPVDIDAYEYYHMAHMYTKKFGLPHGNGWVNELPSTLQILSYFDELRQVVEAWHMGQANKGHGGDLDVGRLS